MGGAGLLLAISVALHAERTRLVFGETTQAEIRISAPGAPADARLEMWTSAGAVVAVRRESPDLFRATWQPPRRRHPQVALVIATLRAAGSVERGWIALALVSKEAIPVQTKPGSRVELAVGNATFGPVRADASGNARIRAKVPPGQRTIRVRVRDPFGNVNESVSDLRPPPFQQVRMFASSERASWTDAEPVRLEIFAVSADGAPASPGILTLTADQGRLGAIEERGPGHFAAEYRAPDASPGTAIVRARVPGDAAGDTVKISHVPGPPAQVRLRATPGEIAGAGEVRIAAEILDGRGNQLPADGVQFASDGFSVSTDGAVAVVRIPSQHDGRNPVRVSARTAGVEGSIEVPLRANPASHADIRPAREPFDPGASNALAAGALVGGQSNFAHATAAGAQLEVAAHPGIRPVEVLARVGVLQYAPASDARPGGFQRGELAGLSFAAGVRASMPVTGRFSGHAAVLGGALRSFGTLSIESGPAAGLRQGTAQWGVMAAAVLGASMRTNAGRVLAEVQFAWAPGRGDLTGNMGGLGVSLGYLFTLR